MFQIENSMPQILASLNTPSSLKPLPDKSECEELSKYSTTSLNHWKRTLALTVEAVSDILILIQNEDDCIEQLEAEINKKNESLSQVWKENEETQKKIDAYESNFG